MFGRQRKEPNKPNISPQDSPLSDITTADEFEEMMYASSSMLENNEQDDTEVTSAQMTQPKQPEVVNVVEKISGILSPYFIVLVGLFLYENNFLLGGILIIVGILSLLKISWTDINNLIEKGKAFFNADN